MAVLFLQNATKVFNLQKYRITVYHFFRFRVCFSCFVLCHNYITKMAVAKFCHSMSMKWSRYRDIFTTDSPTTAKQVCAKMLTEGTYFIGICFIMCVYLNKRKYKQVTPANSAGLQQQVYFTLTQLVSINIIQLGSVFILCPRRCFVKLT